MRLGKALHILSQNRLILRVGELLFRPKKLEELFSMSTVVDETMQERGTIVEVFGPVENPYVVVQLKDPRTDVEPLLEQYFYLIPRQNRIPSRKK